jgi:sialate O-acetylesterase
VFAGPPETFGYPGPTSIPQPLNHAMLRYALPLALVLSTGAQADVKCAALFGDHMVLQRETEVAIWGWADAGEHVTVSGSWSEQERVTVTASDGRWSMRFPTPAAGGPYSLTVSGKNRLVFEDVLIGEVWVCSGQSNMEWPLSRADNGAQEIASANHPSIRHFDVRRHIALQPADDVVGQWAACTPESIGGFSAVGYFFGRELQTRLDVPIGLIGTNWGGTVAEAWTSREGLAAFPEFTTAIDKITETLRSDGKPMSETRRQRQWWGKVQTKGLGARGKWMAAGLDTSQWRAAAVPGLFKDADLGDFDGCVWYRRTVAVPADWKGQDLVLDLGPVDDMDITWFNGGEVGATRVMGKWQTPRSYKVPAEMVHPGRPNVIAVCVVDTGGAGALGLGTDMRLRPASSKPGAGLDLAGEWRLKTGSSMGDLGSFPSGNWFHQNYPTALYNGMLAPIVSYGIRGAIWYQGESNRVRAAQYRRLFPAMIEDWRAKWGIGDFSFYFVQLAPFHYGGDQGQLSELREAQARTLDLDRTGMAVTMDIGNVRNIHPTNKQDVGLRLALWALAKDYDMPVEFSGPVYRSMVVVGDRAHLHFDHAQGLRIDGPEPARFTVAGADRVFHPASLSLEGQTLVVHSDAVAQPAAVRYCWGTDDEGSLFNGAGLPASSFRTDDWPPASSSK